MTFRELISEGFLNKIKNYAYEDVKIGNIIYFAKKDALPSDVNEVIYFNKSEDIIKLKNIDDSKIKEMTIKEFFKLNPSNLDYVGAETGSGLRAYLFWKEVQKRDLIVILNDDAVLEIKGSDGYIKPKKEVEIIVKRQKIKIFIEAEGVYKNETIIFNPNDIKSFINN